MRGVEPGRGIGCRPRPETGFAVCVGGIPGVGKTTLLRTHAETREPRDRQITGSSIVKAIIAPATVRDLDSWPEERRVEVREESIRRLEQLRRETAGRLLIDGHFTLRNRRSGVVEPIFTPGDCGFYDALLLLDASAEQVLAWRCLDTRDRGDETLEELEAHLAAERAEGARLAAVMGVAFAVIRSTGLASRSRELADFLDLHAALGVGQ